MSATPSPAVLAAAISEALDPKKSAPDQQKLGGMGNRTVQVLKLSASKNGYSQMVQKAMKGLSVDQINELHETIPRLHGAGTYYFEVYDEGGTDRDAWTVRLGGGDTPDLGASMSGFPSNGGNGAHVDGSRDIGHGYRYDAELGLLTTPQKQIFSWRQGDPLPGTLGGAPALQWPQSGQQQPGGFPGMGNIPVVDDPRVRLLEDQIRADKHNREIAEMKSSFERLIEQNSQRFEAIVAKLNDNSHKGPSDTEQRLERELAETRRRLEDQTREDRLRAEIKAGQDRMDQILREMAGNKGPDPMIMMLTEVMRSSATASSETVKAMQASTAAQAQSSERAAGIVAERLGSSIMTPLQIVEMIRTAKDTSANDKINTSMVEMFQNLFSMAKGLVKDQAEMFSQGSAPAWLPVAQEGVQALGRVAQMYAATKARESAARFPQAQQQRPQQQMPQQIPQRPVQQQVQPVPQAPQAPQAPSVSARDAAAAQVFTRPSASSSERDAAAAAVFGRAPAMPTPAAVPAAAPAAPATPAAPVAAPVPEPRRRKAKAAAPPAAPAPVAVVPDAVIPRAVHGRPMPIVQELIPASQIPTADVRAVVEQISDTDFFGPALDEVGKLRANLENLSPDDVAGFVIAAQTQLISFGVLPPCIELLQNGHYDILIERLLPDADEESHDAIVEALEKLTNQPAVT